MFVHCMLHLLKVSVPGGTVRVPQRKKKDDERDNAIWQICTYNRSRVSISIQLWRKLLRRVRQFNAGTVPQRRYVQVALPGNRTNLPALPESRMCGRAAMTQILVPPHFSSITPFPVS